MAHQIPARPMRIGILSDTHGDSNRTALAINKLLNNGAEAIFHCGDIGTTSVLVEIASACIDRKVPAYAVLGNVDEWEPDIRDFPGGAGVQVCGRRAEIQFDGKRIAVIHGDDAHAFFATVRNQEFDYVLTGHTHRSDDFREGRTRVINPGAVYRSPAPSVAILDLKTDELVYLPLR